MTPPTTTRKFVVAAHAQHLL